jgi:hypothetical protein
MHCRGNLKLLHLDRDGALSYLMLSLRLDMQHANNVASQVNR